MGTNLLFAGRLVESIAAMRWLPLLNPDVASAHVLLGMTLLLSGRHAEALAAVEQEPDEAWRLSVSPVVYWALGRKVNSDTMLLELEREYAAGSADNMGEMRAYRGEADLAFESLNRA